MKKSEKSTVSKILRLPDEMNDRLKAMADDRGISQNDRLKAMADDRGISQNDRLKAMADDRGISQNEFILKAINAYLESNNNDDTGLVSMDSITTAIDDRFLALESQIQAIREELGTIVEARDLGGAIGQHEPIHDQRAAQPSSTRLKK